MAHGKPRDPHKEQHWRRWGQLWKGSGLTVRDFCARYQLAPPSFYAWRRELKQRDARGRRQAGPRAGRPLERSAGPSGRPRPGRWHRALRTRARRQPWRNQKKTAQALSLRAVAAGVRSRGPGGATPRPFPNLGAARRTQGGRRGSGPGLFGPDAR
jgi:hypothetical protein